jgi:glutamyl/glutaminyl-tRNA synthetase
MGYVSLKEDVEEAVRLAVLAAQNLSSLSEAPSTADFHRLERMVDALLRRCGLIEHAMDDIKKAASEIGSDAGNHIYRMRTEIEQEKESARRFEQEMGRLRLEMAQLRATRKGQLAQPKARNEKKKRRAKVAVREKAVQRLKKHLGGATVLQSGRKKALISSVKQTFSHGRTKAVLVEKRRTKSS